MRKRHIIAIVLVSILIWGTVRWYQPVQINETFTLREGDTISQLYADWGRLDRFKMRMVVRQKAEHIQPGNYLFSGRYHPQEVIDLFLEGPDSTYERITILEGWSSYDIDARLAEKGLIEPGAYRAWVTDPERIASYTDQFEFLQVAQQEREAISSLEGYLYPDTYHVDLSKELLPQLAVLQLRAFQDRVWTPYGEQLRGMSERLASLGYEFTLSTYATVIIASIVEKEEKVTSNKPDVAAVFFNRLTDGMQLDADISLCYGLEQPYKDCPPSVIVEHLRDSNNPYNTRARGGLPPTPIGNPSVETIVALLEARPSSYYYYLHAPSGEIHLSETISEHNMKKSKYLR